MVTTTVRPWVSVLTVCMVSSRLQDDACDRAKGKGKRVFKSQRDAMSKAKSAGFSTERLGRIDRLLQEKYVGPGRMPCAQVLIARRGEVIHQSVLGQRDVQRG